MLYDRVAAFAEDEDVSDEALPFLLLQLSPSLRMMTYLGSFAQTSGPCRSSTSTAISAKPPTSFAR